MTRVLLVVVVAAVTVVAVAMAGGGDDTAAPPAPREEPGSGGVRSADVRAHLAALAAVARRSGGTRAAGTDGDRASVEYVRRALEDAGWRVRTQTVRFPFFEEGRPPVVRLPGGQRLRDGRDMRTMSYSPGGTASGRVRVIGFQPGRESDAGCRRGDFAALRRGEVALVQRGVCLLRIKALNAQARGAAAVLIPNHGADGQTEAIRGTLGEPGVRIPVLSLSTAAGSVVSRTSRVRVSIDATSEERETTNVLAETGSGSRVLMAGAHLDSVSDGPGINDNASGSAGLLAIARALGGRAPRGTTLRFGFWGAEELGLHGSRRYVRGLGRAERRAIAAYVNLDMIGTPDEPPGVYRGDARVTAALRRALRARGRQSGFRSAGRGSDHVPFLDAGIPTGGVFTGLDRCYHRACDDLDNVDARLVTDVAAATARALLRLSEP